MPVDDWFILALLMIFCSIIFCAILPMTIRLLIARQRFRRARLEAQSTCRRSIVNDPNLIQFIRRDSRLNSMFYSQIPFIDDETSL